MATSILEAGLPETPGQKSQGQESWSEACLVAGLPILDAHNTVHGYELLCRGGFDSPLPAATEPAGKEQAPGQSAGKFLGQSLGQSMDRLTRGLSFFIPRTANSLVSSGVIDLPTNRTVIQIAAGSEPTPELVKACRKLKAAGYGLALEDYSGNSGILTEFADYIKVDLAAYNTAARKELLVKAKTTSARLVAKNVETQEQFRQARAEGFDLFEGYYFSRPQSQKDHRIPGNKLVHLEILELIQNDPYDLHRLSQLVSCDPSLTFRLLRLVNSPICAVRQEVTSIQSALLLVGQEVFRRVASVAIVSDLNAEQPAEVLRMALVRSRFCELAASLCELSHAEQYLIGMVSLFPAILGIRMDELVQMLPLRQAASDALQGKEIIEGALLRWMMAIERGDWIACDAVAATYGLKQTVLIRHYDDAITWAEKSLTSMA
jgi:EAL and modified HD-GYP domain-containing signal transduction protein